MLRLATKPKQGMVDLRAVENLWRLYPHTFCERVLSQSSPPWISTRLNRYLGKLIANAFYRRNARVIVNVAPRMGKSHLFSFGCPLWFLEHFPDKKVIVAAYGAELAMDWGRKVRNEFENNYNLHTELREDSRAADRWNTAEGGGMKAVGVDGAIVGFGGNLILVDDPHKGMAEAHSPVMRDRVTNWFSNDLMSRLEPGASVVVLMQRWHRDDLTGYLMKGGCGDWKLISLPALAHKNDPMGRPRGASVCPEIFSRKEILFRRSEMSESRWMAQYEQNPQVDGEGLTYPNFSAVNMNMANLHAELRRDLPVFATFDFNVNPGMHALIGQEQGKADLIVMRHEVHGPRMKTPACAVAVAKLLTRNGRTPFPYPKLRIYGDRSGKTENTQTTRTDYAIIQQIMKNHGIPTQVLVNNTNPPIKDRVEATNEALRDQGGGVHLLVHRDCKLLIRDFENVPNDEDGFPFKGNTNLTHASDACGYAVFCIRPLRRFGVVGGGVYAG